MTNLISTRVGSGQAIGEALDREAVLELSRQKQEPSWLRDLRLDAWETFTALPMPTQRDEAWKRTSLSGLDLRRVVPFAAFAESVVETPDRLPRDLRATVKASSGVGGLLVQRDSSPAFRMLSAELERQGVLFVDLDTAVRAHPELVRDRLAQVVPAAMGKFQALNAAFWSGGAFLFVPRGRALSAPLQTIFSIGTADLGLFPRTLLVAEDQAEVVLVEEYTSAARLGQPLVSAVVEVFAGRSTSVRHVSVQQWGSDAWHFATLRGREERDARLAFVVAATGGRLTRNEVTAVLEGDGSEAELIGLMFGDSNQHFDSQTLQDHVGSHTTSDLLFKVALGDFARSTFTGLVRVNERSVKTSAAQENRNLLLSDHSKADSDPKLEILNSDVVRCSHGATVGPVDEESLFYLMSRGLPRQDAEHLLVEGFFEPVVSRVPVEGLRKKLWHTVQRKLDAQTRES